MRVAFHAGQLLQPVPGGIGRYERAALKHLPAAGVDLVAFAAGARPGNVAPQVPWINLGRPTGSARYELWHRARRPLLAIDADLVHAPSLAVPPPGKLPLVVTVHDIVFLRIPEVMTRRGVAFHRRGLELARREAALVLVPSEFTRTELEREGFPPERVVVTQFGVDPPALRSDDDIDGSLAGLDLTAPYVLSVGTVEPRKDFTTVVRAVEKVRASHPDLEVVIAGPRGWGEVRDIHRPFVRVTGALPWATLDALYRRATVFVSASRYEGFGLPAVEAMSRGIPTIVTRNSALEEVVHDAGLLFAPGDTEACANAIERVLDDEVLRADLARRGQQRAAEMTWARSAAAHVQAYARALGRS
jgi:glycosyltransferase involved in cell wall biosynthesis